MIEKTNNFGSNLKIVEDDYWEIIYRSKSKSNIRSKKIYFNWTKIPPIWRGFWKSITISFFDENVSYLGTFSALFSFHYWLRNTYGDSISTLNNLSRVDFAAFDEYLKQTKVSPETRRKYLNFLACAFEHALVLERDEVTIVVLEEVKAARKSRLSGNKEVNLELNEKVLSISEIERVTKVLVREFFKCEEFLKENNNGLWNAFNSGLFNTWKHGRLLIEQLDMFVIISIWLSLNHGLRSEEIYNLKVSDVLLGTNNKFSIHCRGTENKPERIIPISNSTRRMIETYLFWTEPARNYLINDKENFGIIWKPENGAGYTTKWLPAIAETSESNYRISKFIKRQDLKKDDGSDMSFTLFDLRRSFGSFFASQTQNREVMRQLMGHMTIETTEKHYQGQKNTQLSQNIFEALKVYAYQLSVSYSSPVFNIEQERPDVAKALKENPDRDHDFGICNVPQTTKKLVDSCRRAPTCLECPFLIRETRKLDNYITEKIIWLNLAEEATDERTRQQRLRRVQILEANIFLIEEAIAKHNKKNDEKVGSIVRKKSYKNSVRS